MLQAGEPGPWELDPLALRLDRAYYALTRTTQRHFGREGDGWTHSGVAGLDAATMNRCAIEDARVEDVARIIEDASGFFGERDCTWSIVLSSFRPPSRWHQELVMRGFSVTTTLDVLAREPSAPVPLGAPDDRVRTAEPEELPLFTELLMEVFRMPRRFFPALLEMTEAWRAAGGKAYFGLDEDGKPVATTLLSMTDGVAGVYNVGVLRRARRLGLAKAMMARALEDARFADVVTLQVAPEGFVEGFYLDLGFQPVYHWRFYTPRARIPFFSR